METKNPFIWFGLVLISFIGVGLGVVIAPFQILYRVFSGKYDLWYYFKQIAVSNDFTAGSLIYGSKHTISAITGYRATFEKYHKYQAKFIDYFFGKNHCRNEAIDEKLLNIGTKDV